MPTLSEHLQALAQVTGWSALSQPDSHGVVRVSLEGDLDAVFFALGDSYGLMRGVVLELPQAEGDRAALCEQAAQLQVAAVRDHPSILAFEEPGKLTVPGEEFETTRLICYRAVPWSIDADTCLDEGQSWLDDCAWWKANFNFSNRLGVTANSFVTSSPFSGLKS